MYFFFLVKLIWFLHVLNSYAKVPPDKANMKLGLSMFSPPTSSFQKRLESEGGKDWENIIRDAMLIYKIKGEE